MRDALNNKMSIFSHKDVFVRGMKDAQHIALDPDFPQCGRRKAKMLYSSPRPVCNMKAGSGSFFLTQINKQPRSFLSEMACRDTLGGAAAGLSWWMTEKLTLRSTTARALISFCCASGENKHVARNDAAKLSNPMWPINSCVWSGYYPCTSRNKPC